MPGPFDSMSGRNSGFSAFGQALGNALGGGNGEVYDKTLSRGYELQRKLSEARKATAEANSLEQIPKSLEAAGVPNAQAIGELLIAGKTFNDATNGFGNLQDQALVERASAALEGRSGDDLIQGVNDIRSKRVIERTEIRDGTAYNPRLTPDQTLYMTPGEAMEQETKRTKATMQPAPKAGARDKEYRRLLKDAAQDVLSEAKIGGHDVRGLTVNDVAFSLEHNGSFTTKDGVTIGKWQMKPEDLYGTTDTGVADAMAGAAPRADFSDVSATITQNGLPAPQSKAEYDALPSGTRYIAPDGSKRTKK